MKSAGCLGDGLGQAINKIAVTQKVPCDTFCNSERLRNDTGGRTVVLVRIVNRVRVELDLAVVEVEVRTVVEADTGIRIIAFAHPCHQS